MDIPSLPDISSYAAPVYMVLILFEIFAILRLRAKGDYEASDTVTSLLMGTGNVISKLVFGGVVALVFGSVFQVVYAARLIDIPVTWWAFVLCFVLDDLVFYWAHRFQHTIRWGWANHVVHHSSQHFNLSTALRQPWFGFLTGFALLSVPMIWIGFHPAMIAFCASLNLFYQFFIHTESIDRLPKPIEAVFNTPSHHRVHHGKNPKYLDANYAGVLIIWDRLFGTFVPEDEAEPVRYGIVKDVGSFNPLRVATHEYVAIAKDASARGLTWTERLAYIFAPPGWSHDGSRLTAPQIKQQAVRHESTS